MHSNSVLAMFDDFYVHTRHILHFKCQWILRGVQSLLPAPVQSASGVQVSHVTTNDQVFTSGVQVSHVTTNVQVYTSGVQVSHVTTNVQVYTFGSTMTVSDGRFRYHYNCFKRSLPVPIGWHKDTLPVSIFWFNITGTVVDCGSLHRAGLFEVTIEKTINCFY